jgi:hypothetical protein
VPFQVQDKACATCIYRKDSPLDLAQLEAVIADPYVAGMFTGHRICHHSETACCRGFWNKHKDHFTAGQIAQRLQLVEFVRHDTFGTGA